MAATVERIEKHVAAEDVSAQLAALKSDIANLGAALADLTKSQAREAGKMASDGLKSAGKAARIQAGKAGERASEALSYVETYAEAHPARVAAAAAGLGFLVGIYATRR